jgi:NAD+ kinase
MIRPIDNFSKIAIAAHPKLPDAINTGAQISRYFNKLGYRPFSTILYDEELSSRIKTGKVDLLIALGGDGAMLRAGHICSPYQVPILGINLGHFGFLTEIRGNQWREYLPRILKGDYWLERRMMLCAKLIRDENIVNQTDVLNEVVIGRGKFVHPVHFITSVDGRLLTTYVADALIASTATGSTAYALAAGGPILPPELRNILLVAVAPHLSIDRAIVLAEGSSVSVSIQTDYDALLCIDGQTPINLNNGDQIDVQASENNTQFVRFHDPGYFYRNLTPHMEQNPSTGKQR